MSVIKELPNLEVLSLSVNKIATLRDFATCSRLTELYLRKNAVADLSEVQYLCSLRHLRVLWLWDNPCAEIANYRLVVIHYLPQLSKLDNTEITNEEREAAKGINVEDGISAAPAPAPAVAHQEEERAAPVREMPERQRHRVDPPVQREPVSVSIPAPSQQPEAVAEPYLEERPLNIGLKDARPVSHAARRPAAVRADPEPVIQEARNENILCAVLALLKELDPKSLELVKRDIDRKLAGKR